MKNLHTKSTYSYAAAFLLLALLCFWSWAKWQTVWIERSEGFFPPEFGQIHDLDELAWSKPIYRSNDSYHWVTIADALAAGDHTRLKQNPDEGPFETGRANAWHSGLAYFLATGGKLVASANDWPVERGIHHFAHWAGSILLFACLAAGTVLIHRLAGMTAGLAFVLLYFFNPALAWDFHFSRIDHESCLQLAVLMQFIGLAGCLQERRICWGILAGLGSGLGWWVGATPQVILGLISLLGLLAYLVKNDKDPGLAKALVAWGISGALSLLIFGLLDNRWSHTFGLSAWHPIYALAQLGSGVLCYALAQRHWKNAAIGLSLGISPLIILALQAGDAHVWLDPFMRRLHSHIVEFQSPLTNGLWLQWSSLATAACALWAALLLCTSRDRVRVFLAVSLMLVGLLCLLQTRWLGVLAAISIFSICLSLKHSATWQKALTAILALILAISWTASWVRIEEKPGKLFVADLFLQVGARDIALNLDYQLQRDGTRVGVVALPFSFAPTASLFNSVHPLGSFYWENRSGLSQASTLFSSSEDSTALELCADQQIRYIVVQRMQLGEPFARLIHDASNASSPVETSLAWRLAHGVNTPTWCEEVPFYGTFDPARFSARIYKVNTPQL